MQILCVFRYNFAKKIQFVEPNAKDLRAFPLDPPNRIFGKFNS